MHEKVNARHVTVNVDAASYSSIVRQLPDRLRLHFAKPWPLAHRLTYARYNAGCLRVWIAPSQASARLDPLPDQQPVSP